MSARLITFLVTAAALSSHGQAAEGRLPYMIVGTNQTAVFNAQGRTTAAALNGSFSGQDADFEHPGPSYVDNGDGTVTDAVTGLMWEKGVRLLEISDAERTANAATTGGYDDWRVPTTKELYSLIEFSGAQGSGPPDSPTPPSDAVPFIDTDVFEFEYPSGGGHRYIDAQYGGGGRRGEPGKARQAPQRLIQRDREVAAIDLAAKPHRTSRYVALVAAYPGKIENQRHDAVSVERFVLPKSLPLMRRRTRRTCILFPLQ